jgi:hypothetical protein
MEFSDQIIRATHTLILLIICPPSTPCRASYDYEISSIHCAIWTVGYESRSLLPVLTLDT